MTLNARKTPLIFSSFGAPRRSPARPISSSTGWRWGPGKNPRYPFLARHSPPAVRVFRPAAARFHLLFSFVRAFMSFCARVGSFAIKLVVRPGGRCERPRNVISPHLLGTLKFTPFSRPLTPLRYSAPLSNQGASAALTENAGRTKAEHALQKSSHHPQRPAAFHLEDCPRTRSWRPMLQRLSR